jgi:alkanesulfonate monooxygenase SsuD/methylene tetrahydromethanopterin reductase-like flavin-dependent oxidoreductase (luciferase family)
VSEDGRDLAAHVAEGIYAPGGSTEEAQGYYADIKRRAAALGRDPDHVVIFTGASQVVGGTDEEAARLSRDIYETDNDFDRSSASSAAPSARTTSASMTWTRRSPMSGTWPRRAAAPGAWSWSSGPWSRA